MAERRLLQKDDDEGSLFSRLGTDSPKPRVKFGGMFCNVEGAYENKTLNFESFSPNTARKITRGRADCYSDTFSDSGSVRSDFSSISHTPNRPQPAASSQSQSIVHPTGPKRLHNARREVDHNICYKIRYSNVLTSCSHYTSLTIVYSRLWLWKYVVL